MKGRRHLTHRPVVRRFAPDGCRGPGAWSVNRGGTPGRRPARCCPGTRGRRARKSANPLQIFEGFDQVGLAIPGLSVNQHRVAGTDGGAHLGEHAFGDYHVAERFHQSPVSHPAAAVGHGPVRCTARSAPEPDPRTGRIPASRAYGPSGFGQPQKSAPTPPMPSELLTWTWCRSFKVSTMSAITLYLSPIASDRSCPYIFPRKSRILRTNCSRSDSGRPASAMDSGSSRGRRTGVGLMR